MVKKIFFALLITTLILALFSHCTVVQASMSSIINGADNFVQAGQNSYTNAINPISLRQTVNLIYNALLIVGTCVAVIVATVLGIKFITGSVEQKVKVKESIIPFIIGCVVLFGAFGIWKLVIIIIR